jgi:hypothetical protein
MPTTQVAPLISHEPPKLLKTVGARHGTGNGDQDQGAEVQASLTAFSRTDRTVRDYSVPARHLAER